MSAYTEADLTAIRTAIASGELVIVKDGRRVEYRSINELLEAERRISADLAATASGSRGGTRRFTFTTLRGF